MELVVGLVTILDFVGNFLPDYRRNLRIRHPWQDHLWQESEVADAYQIFTVSNQLESCEFLCAL